MYDQYVGMDIADIPEDQLNLAADSGAYYETDEGTLANYADDPTHDQRIYDAQILTSDEGYIDHKNNGTFDAYSDKAGELKTFDNMDEAYHYAKTGEAFNESTKPTRPQPPVRPGAPITESFVDVDNDPIHYGGVTQDMIDEGQVLAQSVAPSMSEEELRAQGSQTPMPEPNPDLIAKANSFDSDGDPINNTSDSEE